MLPQSSLPTSQLPSWLGAADATLTLDGLGEQDAGNLHIQFDEGALVAWHARASEAPPSERDGNR